MEELSESCLNRSKNCSIYAIKEQRHRFARVLAVAQAEQGDDAPIDREALLAFNEMSEENQEWLENGAPKEDPEEQSGFTCELNEEGCPIIPNPDDIDRFSNKGPVAIRIMRGIYNAAYRKCFSINLYLWWTYHVRYRGGNRE